MTSNWFILMQKDLVVSEIIHSLSVVFKMSKQQFFLLTNKIFWFYILVKLCITNVLYFYTVFFDSPDLTIIIYLFWDQALGHFFCFCWNQLLKCCDRRLETLPCEKWYLHNYCSFFVAREREPRMINCVKYRKK